MLLFHFFIFNFRPLLAAVNAVLGDGVLVGERAVVVRDEVVGAEVASRILKVVPSSDPEHVASVLVRATKNIDNSRFIILQGGVKGILLSSFLPIL